MRRDSLHLLCLRAWVFWGGWPASFQVSGNCHCLPSQLESGSHSAAHKHTLSRRYERSLFARLSLCERFNPYALVAARPAPRTAVWLAKVHVSKVCRVDSPPSFVSLPLFSCISSLQAISRGLFQWLLTFSYDSLCLCLLVWDALHSKTFFCVCVFCVLSLTVAIMFLPDLLRGT